MNEKKQRIVMLCGDGRSSRIMYHGLAGHCEVVCVIVENKPSSKKLIQRRIKRLGLITVGGQLGFMVFNKLLAKISKKRTRQLISDYMLDDSDFPESVVQRIETVNSDETISLLKTLKPDTVVVNGTRIISKKVLNAIEAPFINTHMGITPKYRGVHGGYWALAKNDAENCGVTVHLVDEGIDTGGVLYQDNIEVNPKKDNFNTYPIHQIAKAIPLMQAALDDVQASRLQPKQGVLPSQLWYHPTLFEYIKNYLFSGVK